MEKVDENGIKMDAGGFIGLIETFGDEPLKDHWIIYAVGKDVGKANDLYNLFRRHGLCAFQVVDGTCAPYQQETPRARILAALRDIQSKEAL